MEIEEDNSPRVTNLVDELEESFQSFINVFTKEESLSHNRDVKEELRADCEQNIAKFLEAAKQIEAFFLQRRLQLSVLKPEQILKEECSELRAELARKDELVKKHYEKISVWQSMLADLPGGASSTFPMGEGVTPQSSTPVQQTPQIPFPQR